MAESQHHRIVIIGGGCAGITVAAGLKRKDSKLDIAIVEPSDEHYYQPAFTLVGAGTYKLASTRRAENNLIPAGVKRVKDSAVSFDPDNKSVARQSATPPRLPTSNAGSATSILLHRTWGSSCAGESQGRSSTPSSGATAQTEVPCPKAGGAPRGGSTW